VSSTCLILVRDSSPLRLVFDDDAWRGGYGYQILLTLFRSLGNCVPLSVAGISMRPEATDS
jgi:hypothetical protein